MLCQSAPARLPMDHCTTAEAAWSSLRMKINRLEKPEHTALRAEPASSSFTALARPPRLASPTTASDTRKAPAQPSTPMALPPRMVPRPSSMARVAPR